MPIRSSPRQLAIDWMRQAPVSEIVSAIVSLGPVRAGEIGTGLYLAGSGSIAAEMDKAMARMREDPKGTAVRVGVGVLKGLFGG
jgi:predicted acyltransferase (DUF342 family)